MTYKDLVPPDHFYMVWCEGTIKVSEEHLYFGKATKEAERLSKKYPGKQFYVLRAVRCYQEPALPDAIIHNGKVLDINDYITMHDFLQLPKEIIDQLGKQYQKLYGNIKS